MHTTKHTIMKKLLTCLLCIAAVKTVVSATRDNCTCKTTVHVSKVYYFAKYDPSATTTLHSDIHPLDIFDLRFN